MSENVLQQKLSSKLSAMALFVVSFFYSFAANAALDVSALATKIDEQQGNVETIGLAILGVLVLIAGISLLRRVIR